jgi:hypothetical protein
MPNACESTLERQAFKEAAPESVALEVVEGGSAAAARERQRRAVAAAGRRWRSIRVKNEERGNLFRI